MMLAAMATPLGLPCVQVDAAAEEEARPGRAVIKAPVRMMSCQPGETMVAACPIANYGWVGFSK